MLPHTLLTIIYASANSALKTMYLLKGNEYCFVLCIVLQTRSFSIRTYVVFMPMINDYIKVNNS